MDSLFTLVEKYGTDKSLSGYTNTYSNIFTPIKDKVTSILEIGLGTLNTTIPSSFAGNLQHFEHYKPGGSLRVWRDYFPNADIFGGDIDAEILFEEDRIKTFYLDQLNLKSYQKLNSLIPNNLDLVIDDGLHSIDSSLLTLKFFLKKIKINGHICIEDIPKSSLIFWEFINKILNKNYRNYLFKGKNSYIFICKRIK
jgi:hypothetical protein